MEFVSQQLCDIKRNVSKILTDMVVSKQSNVHLLKYFGFTPGKETIMREKIRLVR